MSNLDRDIKTEDIKITDFVDELRKDEFLIPTFQREFVWNPDNIIKLWDSIFRFYPVGSLLYWVTDSYLHTHRQLGGFEFPHDEDTVRQFESWRYILDGQQRATSLLVSILGGTARIEDDQEFDYTLYFDAAKGEFFFANEFEKRKASVPEPFLVRIRDVPYWGFNFYAEVSTVEGFSDAIEHNLAQLDRMFKEYRLSLVRIKGVEVNEVCEIFERINQEGKKLDPFDIIVARTYRTENAETGQPSFYLREKTEELYHVLVEKGSRFQEFEPLTIVQMVAMCLRKQHSGSRNPFGITPSALSNLQTKDFEENWDECRHTILATIKFLSDMKIQGPAMLPFVYLALPLCYYLHGNNSPKPHIARQWFWQTAFGSDSFRQSTMVYQFAEDFFGALEQGSAPPLPQLQISRNMLVESNYRARNSLSRAVMGFLATQNPRDFTDLEAEVLDNVYLNLAQAPNLDHIYPRNFLKRINGFPEDGQIDSLMNLCFLRARTNIQVGQKNPLTYFDQFRSEVHDFGKILQSHLIPEDFTTRDSFEPDDYRDFLYARAALFIEQLDEALPDTELVVVE